MIHRIALQSKYINSFKGGDGNNVDNRQDDEDVWVRRDTFE